MVKASELPVTVTTDAESLAEALVGDGVQILEAKLSGGSTQAGLFEDGTSVMEGVVDFDEGLIFSTGDVTSITHSKGSANTSSSTSQNTAGVDGDTDFDGLSNGTGSFDAVYLEIKFVPTGDTVSLDVVFGSEEYNEYVYAGFNDSFAAYLNDENIALTPDGEPIGIDTINAAGKVAPKYGSDDNDPNAGHDTTDGEFESANESLFVDNTTKWGGAYNTEMDGFTKTISIQGKVIPGEVNTLKIGIADSGDASLNSYVLVRSASFSSSLVAEPDEVTVAANDEATIAPLENDVDSDGDPLAITRLNGIEVVAGDTVTLVNGQTVTLNADNTLTVQGNGAQAGADSFTYQVSDTDGNVATGIISLTTTEPTPICFTPGTRLLTPAGWVSIDDLVPGDLVMTHDHGPQPIRWVGRRRLDARRLARCPALRPVRIAKDRFGPGIPARDLVLSPLHRVLLTGWEADLLFG
ncbi:choice-of-anchor L domain-containing protein [Rhodobacteraceae bacterium NNCM2]|nr:choice-of-anchor L domain-containing protein [Coraliihabitans acroporae]